MVTTMNSMASNSFNFGSSKAQASSTTCNLCKRLLYSFEEILVCRICHGSYHWRCLKPETVAQFDDNRNFICENCSENTTSSSSHKISNGNTKIMRSESNPRDYRDFANLPSKPNSTDTNVHNAIRYFEEKQLQAQVNKTAKTSEIDAYLPSPTVVSKAYYLHDGQYNDGSRLARRTQQQSNEIDTDTQNDTSAMFQANYQYTPLKEYAAMRNHQPIDDNINTKTYQNSPSDSSIHQGTSRYGGGLRYLNHGYDPTVTRVVEVPVCEATNLANPAINILSVHNHPNRYVTETNLNINENSHRSSQQDTEKKAPLNSKAPHLTDYHDEDNDDSIVFKPTRRQEEPKRQYKDHHSTVDNDSGIVATHLTTSENEPSEENQIVERRLTNLVQQLGKQLENDAQKINEKLESKLKKLEEMINQQTYVIRQQDDVIERLKSKIQKIETERDHFRDRLNVHEQRELDGKQSLSSNDKNEQNNQPTQKRSETSTTTDSNKSQPKKSAPRIVPPKATTKNENEPVVAQSLASFLTNRQRAPSEESSEAPAASSRLDNMIRQPKETKEANDTQSSTSNYSLAQVRHQGTKRNLAPISSEQEVVTSVHQSNEKTNDTQDGDDLSSNNQDTDYLKPNNLDDNDDKIADTQRRRDSVASSASINSRITKPMNPISTKPYESSNIHRSFESLQSRSYSTNLGYRASNRTGSLDFSSRPVHNDDQGSNNITSVEGDVPANQLTAAVKGYLRKQNRHSLLKLIERYYCVLKQGSILMFRNENDLTPQKIINLKGSKIISYDDSKHGRTIELTWSRNAKNVKTYRLYVPNRAESTQWETNLQTVIRDFDRKNEWYPYRLNA